MDKRRLRVSTKTKRVKGNTVTESQRNQEQTSRMPNGSASNRSASRRLRWQGPHTWPIQLAVALLLVTIATALTLWVSPLTPQFTYGFFFAAVLLATLYSGLGAGVFSTLLGMLLGDYFIVRPAGRVLSTPEEWLHAFSFAIVAGLICFLIYQRTKSEDRLRERERFIENLAATAPYTLYLYDVPGERIAYMAAGKNGSDHDDSQDGEHGGGAAGRVGQLVALPPNMLPEDQLRYREHISDLAGGPPGLVLTFQHRILLPNGELRWCERQEQVFDRLEGGAVHHLLGVAQDITERKAVEEKVLYQAQLLNSVDQAVITVDLDNRITFWNRYAETLYGWRAAEVVGKTITGLLAPPAVRTLSDEIMQRLRSGQSWSGEILLQRRDGSTFYADLIDAPIFDENGALAGIMGVSVDTSERKRAETYLQFLADASLELSSSLDYKTTIQRVADLTVPRLADWCSVDLLRADGSVELVAVAHVEPDKVRWAQELRRQYPPTLEEEGGLAKVIKTGEAEFYPDITPEMVAQATQGDEEALAIMNKIGMRSIIIVPLRSRTRVIGALTLVWSESNRHYSTPDVVFAEELANRAAIAVDNAMLYQEVQIAEQQQAELLAQMESLVANAPIGIAFLDRDLRFIRVNDALASFNGLPVDAHLEHRMDELLPEVMPLAGADVQYVLDSGQAVLNREISGEVTGRPGRISHFLASWYPVVLEGGRPQYIGALVVDITERKRIEEELRASEDRFRSTFEQAAVGISHVGLDGRWLRVNNRLCEIVGYSRDELLQMTFQDITYPEDMQPDVELVQDAIAGRRDGYRLEKRYRRKDGALVWIQLTVSLVRDAQTRAPQYFISVVEDITSRKNTETQLLLLAESSRVLFPSLVDERTLQAAADLLVPRLADWCVINLRDEEDGGIEPVAVAHRDGDKVASLRAMISSYPLVQEQQAGAPTGTPAVIRSGEAYFLPEIGPAELASDSRFAALEPMGLASMIIVPLQARSQTIGAITLVRSDSWHRYTEADLRFVEELARRIALAVDNAHLYTSARSAEAQLRQLNESLEDRVVERTAELERSNRELDRFAYVASHDLKAPLRAIDNLSTWLYQDANDVLPPPSQEHLQKLRGRVRRMERLLDDLLAYSRAGRVQHAPQEVDCGALVRSIFDLLSPPPEFRLTVYEPMPVIYTQRVPLETVLRNLLGNAVKHHNRPDGHVQVAAHWTGQGDLLEFSVQDDGPGMAAEYHERIFELFQTLQPRDQVEGSGMGLAIVKKTVESLGGSVSVESTEGSGTCFRFTWPVKQAEFQS